MVTYREYEVMRYIFIKKLMPLMAFYMDMAVLLGMAHREIIKIHVDDLHVIKERLEKFGYAKNAKNIIKIHEDSEYDLVFGSDSKIGVIGASTIQQNMNRCCELAKIDNPPTSKDLRKLHGRLFIAERYFSKDAFNILRRKWGFDSNSELAEWIGVKLPEFEKKGKPLPNYKLREELKKYTDATARLKDHLEFVGVDTSKINLFKVISVIYKL